jgi:hypothetical protein
MTYDEWFREFFSRDERMHPSLLRCPAGNGVQRQKTLAKIDERGTIRHFCR